MCMNHTCKTMTIHNILNHQWLLVLFPVIYTPKCHLIVKRKQKAVDKLPATIIAIKVLINHRSQLTLFAHTICERVAKKSCEKNHMILHGNTWTQHTLWLHYLWWFLLYYQYLRKYTSFSLLYFICYLYSISLFIYFHHFLFWSKKVTWFRM